MKKELDWLKSNKCKYCGCELAYSFGSERIICRSCGEINYKNSKVKFQNKLKRNILKIKKKKK